MTIAQEVCFGVEWALSSTSTFVGNVWHDYVAVTDAAKENRKLKVEINQLKARMLDYGATVAEVNRLRALLNFPDKNRELMLPADVVSVSNRDNFSIIRINRGQSDGVQIGMPVIAAEGIVGRTLRVGSFYSDIQILGDTTLSMDIVVERTRERGVLHGGAFGNCHLSLHRRSNIRIGDEILTSGQTGGFPPGIPVGRVTRIAYDTDQVSQRVTIEPLVNFHRLDEVMIVRQPNPAMGKIMDIAGGGWLDKVLGQIE